MYSDAWSWIGKNGISRSNQIQGSKKLDFLITEMLEEKGKETLKDL